MAMRTAGCKTSAEKSHRRPSSVKSALTTSWITNVHY